MTSHEFDQLVEQAYALIPARFRRRLQNIALVVEPEPSPRQLSEAGVPPGNTLLGLYQGRPLTARSVFDNFAMPDRIIIFQGPHERLAHSDEHLKQLVEDTIWHEVAHYFGMDERRVRAAERRRRTPARRLLLILLLLIPRPAWCWGDEGHQIVARIAAAHLTEQAQQAIARLLQQDPDIAATPTQSVAELMARAAIWPDHMPGGKGDTASWHYIDIGLFEGPAHMAERCPNGNCIVAKMVQYLANLKQHHPDGRWSEYKELEFLVHFGGDIHQPLHCATDADAGGNCVQVRGFDPIHNLHLVWDITLVEKLMAKDGPGMLAAMESRFQQQRKRWEHYGSIEQIAAESFRLAKSQVYGKARPRVPLIHTFVEVVPRYCSTQAPENLREVQVDGPRSYGDSSLDLVRQQLYRAGVRLAAMLNSIYSS
jgi:predicted Zn-dependent protease with MMP-like domain